MVGARRVDAAVDVSVDPRAFKPPPQPTLETIAERDRGRLGVLVVPAPSSSPPFAPATWRELDIDWGRRHLQCVFVDDGHGVLARGAEGVCQRVAKWAGAGHMGAASPPA